MSLYLFLPCVIAGELGILSLNVIVDESYLQFQESVVLSLVSYAYADYQT